jgi:hypothetical protein
VLNGSTTGGGSHTAASCNADGVDRVYAITPSANGFLTASLKRGPTNYDSVLYISTACSDAADVNDVLCADSYDAVNNQPLNGGEVLSMRVTGGTTYYLFVDGFDANDAGAYELTVDLSSGLDCNDPVPIPLEAGSSMTVLGNNNNNANVQGSCGGGPGGEVVYRIVRSTTGPLDVDTDATYTNYNSVLYARSNCNDGFSQLACSNQAGGAMESIGLQTVTVNVPVFVWVDGSTSGGGSAFGNYGLTLTP